MKTATCTALVAVCLFAGSADAGCYDWGLPGYTQNVADCQFAATLWTNYCTPAYGPPCGCETGCGTGCGGSALFARMKEKMAARKAAQACSCCAPGGSWCNGCNSGCGRVGTGMKGWWRSMGASSWGGGGGCDAGCGGGCDTGCDTGCGCGGGLGGFGWLKGANGGCGTCQRRYGGLSGFESLCERMRGCGSCRSWIGGGPLDRCGLASYTSYPNGIDYSYLNHVTAPAVYAAPSAATGVPTEADETTRLGEKESAPLYDDNESYEPRRQNRDSELLPLGDAEDEA